ncbi:MAG: aminotransferase class V-fold PLP-dependent enzyme [Mycobacteriaceae bacterium]|nr:aminotransferase class V-fold PLP-dependent enzyme [Mycobacteriaceae bacterium]
MAAAGALCPADVRAQFPALAAEPRVAYLDSASTTQKPRGVVDAVARALSERTASPRRGEYPWATRLSAEIERVRSAVARFLGAERDDAVVFTAGATAAMNAVAHGWGLAGLADGDEIVYCPDDHTSTVAPWLALRDTLSRFGVAVRLVPVRRTESGALTAGALAAAVTGRTRMVVLSHVHGVSGVRAEPAELRRLLDPSVLLCLDCAQSAGHLPVDLARLGADFAVVSGHKMFAAPGVGVLYCAPRTHAALRAHAPGGGAGALGDRMPARLEGGTLDAPAILSLGAAVDFLDSVGIDAVERHTRDLTRRAVARLASVPGVRLRSGEHAASGIVSFHVPGIRSADIGFALSAEQVYVRAGGHCLAGPDAEAVRLSVHVYTTPAEVDRACDLLTHIAESA